MARTRVGKIALKLGLKKEEWPKTILVDETTGRSWNAHTYRHVFADIRAEAVKCCASLRGKQDRDLRDTTVTWLARADATLPEIASITGHSLASIHDIMKHYLAITPELGDIGITKLTTWMAREGIEVA